jgi:hypothetical protein
MTKCKNIGPLKANNSVSPPCVVYPSLMGIQLVAETSESSLHDSNREAVIQ